MRRINFKNQKINEHEIVKKDPLSRRQKSIISQAINALSSSECMNKNKIVEYISEHLIALYGDGNHLETQLKRMGILSIKDIEHKVDSYIVSHIKLNQ